MYCLYSRYLRWGRERVSRRARLHEVTKSRMRQVEESEKATHHLPCGHTYSLDGELAPTHIEQVLQTRPQQVDYEDIMKPLLPEVVYLGYSRCRTPKATAQPGEKRRERKRKCVPSAQAQELE